jgi:hypothetical protein
LQDRRLELVGEPAWPRSHEVTLDSAATPPPGEST